MQFQLDVLSKGSDVAELAAAEWPKLTLAVPPASASGDSAATFTGPTSVSIKTSAVPLVLPLHKPLHNTLPCANLPLNQPFESKHFELAPRSPSQQLQQQPVLRQPRPLLQPAFFALPMPPSLPGCRLAHHFG